MLARMLRKEDCLDVTALAKQHHASSRYAHIPFRGSSVYALCDVCLNNPRYACVVLALPDRVVGYCAITIDTYMWADVPVATDIALYVDPEHRSLSAFTLLLTAVEAICRERGVHTLNVSMTSNAEEWTAKRYGQLYRRKGYEWHGEIFSKEFV